MIELYNNIRERTLAEILSDGELLRSLLILASALLLNDGAPALCNSCIAEYYQKIVANFDELYKNYNDMKQRICKPKWVGIKYVKGAFYNSDTITDEQAISALKNGYLTEKDFEVLPNEKKEESIELIEDKPKEVKRKPKK